MILNDIDVFAQSRTVMRTGVTSVRVKRMMCILDVEFSPDKNLATVITTCPECRLPNVVQNLPADSTMAWLQDLDLIQNLMPDISVADRESLLTGIHNSCFQELWDEDET